MTERIDDARNARPDMRRRGLIATGAVLLGGGTLLPAAPAAAAASPALTREAIFFDPAAPVLGNPKGTLPIAEFFDYRCPYCRGMHPLLQRLIAGSPDTRFVAKQWPIFGGVSILAARVALAAAWQGRFAAMNDALFAAPVTDDASVMQAARKAGLDPARLARDLKTRAAELDRALGTVAMQANALGLQGTPALIIGNYLIPGALDEKNLARVVRDARSQLARQSG
ncbi:MAG: DsbA family protein [Rhodospirillales bacterium]|nr:DsbA family protein [Rhodospirillales bacterium]